MAQQLIQTNVARISIRHRAICMDDRYKGPWRANLKEAWEDASQHTNKPGNANHIIDVVTEQSIRIRYMTDG